YSECVDVCAGSSGSAQCQASKGEGAACTAGNGECSFLLTCGGGKCAPWSRLGESCGVIAGEFTPCQSGFCKQQTSDNGADVVGTCTAAVATGGACDPNAAIFAENPCEPGSRCAGPVSLETCVLTSCY